MFTEQPKWKHWLSWLTDVPLEKVQSPLTGSLEVALSKGRLLLSANNAIYSYDDLYYNFSNSFAKLNLSKIPEHGHALVLGFGLGSIPFILEKNFGKQLKYTGIEIDGEVIKLAKRFSLPRLASKVQLLENDALAFAAKERETLYDLICMDVFIDDSVPQAFQERAFLQHLEAILHPDGVLLFNRLSRNEMEELDSHRYFETVFKSVFPNGKHLKIGGNWMLISDGSALL